MQFNLILFFVILISAIEAASFPKMSKPKLIPLTRKQTASQSPARRLPEERRTLSVFPKNNKKFYIDLPPTNENPNFYQTKKPLMKKIRFQNKETVFNKISPVIESLETNTEPVDEEVLKVSAVSYMVVINKESKPEMVNEAYEETQRIQDILTDEDMRTEMYPININSDENIDQNEEYIIQKRLTENDSDDEGQKADWLEFMFINNVNLGQDANDVTVNKQIATAADPMKRMKRSDNIIEEENLGTTMSGHRFTWRDTRLTNNIIFKNIHS